MAPKNKLLSGFEAPVCPECGTNDDVGAVADNKIGCYSCGWSAKAPTGEPAAPEASVPKPKSQLKHPKKTQSYKVPKTNYILAPNQIAHPPQPWVDKHWSKLPPFGQTTPDPKITWATLDPKWKVAVWSEHMLKHPPFEMSNTCADEGVAEELKDEWSKKVYTPEYKYLKWADYAHNEPEPKYEKPMSEDMLNSLKFASYKLSNPPSSLAAVSGSNANLADSVFGGMNDDQKLAAWVDHMKAHPPKAAAGVFQGKNWKTVPLTQKMNLWNTYGHLEGTTEKPEEPYVYPKHPVKKDGAYYDPTSPNWTCPDCKEHETYHEFSCSNCGAANPKPKGWLCDCELANHEDDTVCTGCGEANPAVSAIPPDGFRSWDAVPKTYDFKENKFGPRGANDNATVAKQVYNQIWNESKRRLANAANEPDGESGIIPLHDLHTRHSQITKEIGAHLFAGTAKLEHLYRSYKHTPHTPPSMLLKYIVHRANHVADYEDQQKAQQQDEWFFKLHSFGKAAEKNGHVRPQDLHHWFLQNPHLIEDAMEHRDHLQNLVKRGVGLKLRDIDGQTYVALVRGLGTKVMKHEHSLSSFADIPSTAEGFGGILHHTWVPLKDLWYSFDHGSRYANGEHGAEDEYLVSNVRPRYKAHSDDLKHSRFKGKELYPNAKFDVKKVQHLFENTTDEELAESLKLGLNENSPAHAALPQEIAKHKNFGPKSAALVREFVKRNEAKNKPGKKEPLPVWFAATKHATAEEAVHAVLHGYRGVLADEVVKNPNLQAAHLKEIGSGHLARIVGGMRCDPRDTRGLMEGIFNHPNCDAETVRRLRNTAQIIEAGLPPKGPNDRNAYDYRDLPSPSDVRFNVEEALDASRSAKKQDEKTMDENIQDLMNSGKPLHYYRIMHLVNARQAERLFNHALERSDPSGLDSVLLRAPLTDSIVDRYLESAWVRDNGSVWNKSNAVPLANPKLTDGQFDKLINAYANASTPTRFQGDLRALESMVRADGVLLSENRQKSLAEAFKKFAGSGDADKSSEASAGHPYEAASAAANILLLNGLKPEIRQEILRTVPVQNLSYVITYGSYNQQATTTAEAVDALFHDKARETVEHYINSLANNIAPLKPLFAHDPENERYWLAACACLRVKRQEEIVKMNELKGHIIKPLPVEMKKAQTPWAVPGVGGRDDRRETPMVNSGSDYVMKRKLMHSATYLGTNVNRQSEAHKDDQHMFVLDGVDSRGTQFTAHSPAYYMRQPGQVYAKKVPANTVTIGYAKTGDLLPGGDKTVNGTVQHENWHGLMARVAQKRGPHARVALAQNLYNAIPIQYRDSIDKLHTALAGDTHRGQPQEHEEKLANILNYLNSDGDRNTFHERAGHNEHERRRFDVAIKRANQALRAASQVATNKWIVPGHIAPGTLKKNHPAPTFPKLGGGNAIPNIVHTKRQVDIQHHAAVNGALQGIPKVKQLDDEGKRHVVNRLMERQSNGTQDVGGVSTQTVSGPQTYTLGSSLNNDGGLGAGPNSDLATAQHENLHHALGLIEHKHGRKARENLVTNLWAGLGSLQEPVDIHLNALGYNNKNDSHYREEGLAHIYNYINDPHFRNQMHGADTSPELRNDFHTKMKQAHQAIQNMAKVADTNWLNDPLHAAKLGIAKRQEFRKQFESYSPALDQWPEGEVERLRNFHPFLAKGERGDWSNEGYEIHHQLDPSGKQVTVTAHLNGQKVGDLDAGHSAAEPGSLHPIMTFVHHDHRRKGIATAMYQRAEQVLGAKFKRGNYQSPEAKALWAQKGRPFGKSEGRNLTGSSEVVHDMLGYKPHLDAAFKAAQFLAGASASADPARVRGALYDHDGDIEAVALQAYGLDVHERNRLALRNVMKLPSFSKGETQPKISPVRPVVPEANEAAEEINAAIGEDHFEEIKLSGRHSAGTMLVHGKKHTWLLKPGSGPQSPAAGARENAATQSAREAAFWHVANAWEMGDDFPRADLVQMNGKEVAAIHMLPFSWKNALKLEVKDAHAMRHVLNRYREHGLLHRWAIIDFVLGNPDRHGQNLMVSEDGEIKLIDHGSAFAGPEFDPAHDGNSFVPYYLRAWAPEKKFAKMPTSEKLRVMPTVNVQTRQQLREWVDSLDGSMLQSILTHFNIDSTACMARFERVKTLSADIDEAINRLWVTV